MTGHSLIYFCRSTYIVISLLALIVGVGIVALLKSGARDISSANPTNTTASAPSTNSPKPTPKRQRTEPITIPLMSYISANWDEYNPGFSGRDAQHAVNIWMRAKGYITYRVTIPEIQEDTSIILVRLSSELDDEYARNPTPADSSDVTLIINGNRQETKNVIADDGFGKDYQWVVPSNNFHAGSNEITFRVGDGTHNNGITIHTPIRISFQ